MIKLALIGCGRWGKNYLKTLASLEGCELVWVCDLDLGKLQDVVSAYPQIKITEYISDVLNDPAVQGVVIATSPESHYGLAKKFISKGKAVLVEKPVTINRQDSIDLINLSAAHNTILMAGYILIYHPAVEKIKNFLTENNFIEHLCYINMSRTHSLPQAAGVDVLHDLAVHDIYLAHYLTGEDPIWVIAHGGRYGESFDNNVINIILGLPNGKIASIFASAIHSEKTRKITLVTPKTKLVFDDVQPAGQKIQLFFNGENNQFLDINEHAQPLQCECLHFMECIRENREPKSGSRRINFVAKMTEYITESLAKGGEKVIIPE